MVKAYADKSMNMNIRQFLVTGRQKPTEAVPEPQVFALRVFAKDEAVAKSKFWKQMSLLNKIKRAVGQILSVNEVPFLSRLMKKIPTMLRLMVWL